MSPREVRKSLPQKTNRPAVYLGASPSGRRRPRGRRVLPNTERSDQEPSGQLGKVSTGLSRAEVLAGTVGSRSRHLGQAEKEGPQSPNWRFI